MRPGLHKFLKDMYKKYELVIQTASEEKYAFPVILKMGIRKYVSHFLFRPSCTKINNFYLKDLSRLGRELHRVVIVDNDPR
jgi:RNA polymerase II subunit A small phosphatase-like protein